MDHPTNSEVEALLRQSFLAFVEKVFHTLNPGQVFRDNWHIEAIVYQLLLIQRGQNKRLMVNVPPRSLKSMIVSVAWPAFLLGHNPSLEIMVVSHSYELAADLSNLFRKVVDAAWYKSAFPTMAGAPEKDNEKVFKTTEGGKRIAVSVKGSITGIGADIIILDDPLDASDVATETACHTVNTWLDIVLSTRLNNLATGAIVLVMQRLSISDPSAHLAETETWHKLVLPAKAEIDLDVPIGDNEIYPFKKGTLLHPERLDCATLDAQRLKMGEAAFQAQYQQQPIPGGGGVIDIALFQRYQEAPKAYDIRFISIDAATGSNSGSYSVIQLYQMTDGCLYLLYSQRGYWAFNDLTKRVIAAQAEAKADFIVIEFASSGQALLEVLWDHYPEDVRRQLLQKRDPKPSKVVRMEKAMVLVAQDKVWLPESADWLQLLITELQAFPGGVNDDQVDALSQAIDFYRDLMHSRYNLEYKNRGRVLARW